MLTRKSMQSFIEKCDIYFENELISKEMLIKTFADFIASTFGEQDRNVGVIFHTGSICFDIISILTAAFGSLILDGSDVDDLISSLSIGDMVQFKNNRYVWGGLGKFEGLQKSFVSVTDIENATYFLLIQRKSDKYLGETETRTMEPMINKNLIIPYNGSSETTDGRGLKRAKTNRAAFITYLLGIAATEISSAPDVSSVIVAERDNADRIIKGISISYDDNKTVNLLDIVTASYFTDGEEYRYAGNPGRNDPVLKITGKISTARELILDKSGNKAVGLIVLGADSIFKGRSELPDLVNRKSLRYIYLSANIDTVNGEEILTICEDTAISIFACTKEFLMQYSMPLQEKNRFAAALDKQVKNIINKEIESVIVACGCTWESYRTLKESLYFMRKDDWNSEDKDLFILNAYTLLNLFTTAVFTMEKLEKAISGGVLNGTVVSPRERIKELWKIADKLPKYFVERAINIIETLENLFAENETECQKYNKLKKLLNAEIGRRIAVIVPKAYYSNVLAEDNAIFGENVTVMTANRFDNSILYDKVIVVGDVSGKHFDVFKCSAAPRITVLLYDYESHLFRYRERAARNFERDLHKRIGTVSVENDSSGETTGKNDRPSDGEEISNLSSITSDLDYYVSRIGNFDLNSLIGQSAGSGATATADVVATGTFSGGERIFFSKYYKAFVFDKVAETVTETDVDKLESGDILIFTRRDDFAKNMVDNIFDELLSTDRLSENVKDAAFKSAYWKLVLQEYIDKHGFTYRDVSAQLSRLGCKRHEVTIRAWLNIENRIIGPIDEEAFAQIGALTDDPDIKREPKNFYEACRIIRHERREILNLIGRAIIDKLRGNLSERGGLLEAVYENVDKLAVISELESITELEEPLAIPINMINRPLNA